MTADAFASKAEKYAKYRADYPAALVDWVADRIGVSPEHTVVELGSGTGLLAQQLLDKVRVLYAVEHEGKVGPPVAEAAK